MRQFTFPLLGREFPVSVPERPEDLAHFIAWLSRQLQPVAVDTETHGLSVLSGDPEYVRLVQFGSQDEAWNIPTELGAPFKEAARTALRILIDGVGITGHNWHGFDAPALHVHLGIPYDDLCKNAVDTMLCSKLVDPRAVQEGGIGSSLKPLSDHYIDPTAADTQGDLTAVFRSLGLVKANGFSRIDLWHPVYQSYGGGDVLLTARLRPKLEEKLRTLGVPQRLVDYEHEVARICGHMQIRGLLLDQDYTRRLADELGEEEETQTAIVRSYGVEKLGSPAQIAEALIGMGEALTERTAGGAVKADKSVLSALADMDLYGNRLGVRTPNPLAVAVIKAKRAGKWKSAYADNFLTSLDRTGRIHPGIRTMQARTGRMSVTNPAVQTLPSGDWKIRRCFLAEPGERIISVDFQAVELRVLAALAGVARMKEAINAGRDLHSFTAELVFGPDFTPKHRKISKAIGFGVVYGGGAATIQRQTGAPLEEVKRAVAAYHRTYPEVRRAANRWQREAFSNGMVTTSVTGRRLPLDRDRTYAVTNYQVQSAARDCLGQALINMEAAGLLSYLRLPVHDEIIASAPAAEAEEIGRAIGECMTFDLFGVPIESDPEIGGRSWGSLYLPGDQRAAHDEWYAAQPVAA
ncbi:MULTISPECIES: DNA polymerase [unclassified Streptomyces]|uniref:DNA polymerase n=1 Tax=unclassified Streptomyces TaxID=2593676 RepID=UPI00036ADBE9|nr:MULTISPECIES: DNA polymerase [unclassified Streptomyces]MYY03099.1 DNA polymerase [Streptomyces sp. SID4913]